ncbi:alpha/beta hydrolase [Methylocystis parvus]|uniref:Alpha/beta hydrolase n=1 Tax=Methylocystis parvus TaxID=134 RepID=A0A6B8M9M4_9HYPH|nr:alpha/beta hydrolase [Methylocystis parvus]QGM99308.1 alpha/beta hydrolase [Methylocystis parvus]WBK00302.1 alpha/beta hydrolase [Methylocystis parvus OBBP]
MSRFPFTILSFSALLAFFSGAWAKTRPPTPPADAPAAAAANAQPGPRHVPPRVIPVPGDVSKQLQAFIRMPYPPGVLSPPPKTAAEWGALNKRFAAEWTAPLADLRKQLHVSVEATEIAGVKAYLVTPRDLRPENVNRMLLHLHGGGYVFGGGEAATSEAIMMAGIGGYRVISVDYRMPPDFPFPAGLDDALTVWRSIAQTIDPRNMAVFGSSAGGGLALAMALKAKDEGLPLPAAVSAGTPWSDLDKIGDSYFANEYVDNMLVAWDGWLGGAARLYANGHDLKNPYLSPVYGNYKNFPPTILTTGTRDLFLSNTVRVHRALRRAGAEADLNVYEGMSHAQYAGPGMPEAREVFEDIARFFDARLGR